MTTYNPFSAAIRMAKPPPCVTYVAHSLDGGHFARCDGCGWHGELVDMAAEAWAAAKEHMVTTDTKESA